MSWFPLSFWLFLLWVHIFIYTHICTLICVARTLICMGPRVALGVVSQVLSTFGRVDLFRWGQCPRRHCQKRAQNCLELWATWCRCWAGTYWGPLESSKWSSKCSTISPTYIAFIFLVFVCFETVLSVAWSSPSKRGWLATEPRDPPIFVAPVLGSQEHATMPSFLYGAGIWTQALTLALKALYRCHWPPFSIISPSSWPPWALCSLLLGLFVHWFPGGRWQTTFNPKHASSS